MTFYSGEAILALLEYAPLSERRQYYVDRAREAQEYYLAKYVDSIADNYYPAYVPWHSMSLHRLVTAGGVDDNVSDEYRHAVFRLTDTLLVLQDRGRFPGRFYNAQFPQFGAPHASSDAVYTEGLAYAYDLARQSGDDLRMHEYAEGIALAVRNLRTLQLTDYDGAAAFGQHRVVGAVRTRVASHVIRVDAVQHMIDAYRQIVAVLEAES